MNRIFKELFFRYLAAVVLLCFIGFVVLLVLFKNNYEKELEKTSYERLDILGNSINIFDKSIRDRIRHSVLMDDYAGDNSFKNLKMAYCDSSLIEKLYLFKGSRLLLGLSKYDIVNEQEEDLSEDLSNVLTYEDGKITYARPFYVGEYNIVYYISITKLVQLFSNSLPEGFEIGIVDESGEIIFFSDYSIMFAKAHIENYSNTHFESGHFEKRISVKVEIGDINSVYLAVYMPSHFFNKRHIGIFIDNKVIEIYILQTFLNFIFPLFLILAITVFIVYLYSRKFSGPIEKLAGLVGKFPEDSFYISPLDFPDNEIRTLAVKFRDAQERVFLQIEKNEELINDLKKQSNLMDKMLEFLPSGVVVVNRDNFLIKYINKAFVKNTEVNMKDVCGLHFLNIYCESGKKNEIAGLITGLDRTKVFYSVNPKQDIGIKYSSKVVNAFFVPIDSELVMIIMVDIEKEKEAMDTIKSQHRLIESFFDSIPEMAFMKDRYLRYLLVNRAFEDFTGFKTERVKGMRETEIYPRETSEYIIEYEKRILSSKKPVKYEVILGKDNDKKIIEVFKTPICNDVGEVEYIVGVARDITEYKNYTSEIQRQKDLFATVINSLREGILVVDSNGNVLLSNSFIKWIFKEIGHIDDLKAFVKDDFKGDFQDKVDTLLKDKMISKVYGNIQIKDIEGSEKDLFYAGHPIKYPESDKSFYVFVFRDETEKNIIVSRLATMERSESVGQIIGGIAHDFKNFLAAIYNYLAIYNMEFKLESEQKEYINNIFRVLEKARYLSEELLGITKGRKKGDDVSSIKRVSDEVALFVFSGTEVVFENKVGDEIWDVLIDSNQLSQILHNIFLNAAQFIQGSGRVEISAENTEVNDNNSLKPGKYVKIKISDTGTGIDNDKLEKIFEPYFTTKEKGTGLGLYIIKSIIEKAGGSINISSEKGVGTVVEIILPSKGESSFEQQEFFDKADEKNIKQNTRKKHKVLIMDDQKDILDSLKGLLQLFDCNVEISENSDEALEIFSKRFGTGESFDVIFTDLTVPGGKGGLDLLERVRKLDKNIPIVLMSGYADVDSVKSYLGYGFYSIISKPFRVDEIQNILDNL
ncbi:MAG: multi-sensor signal transduction histidine kinase [Deferribacteraceae bacterium]|nr:multi-sensor signal transduction histidine kinase [Deferribacteraceae bacterium]